MDAKSSDMALFHKLIKKQRGQLGACVNELHVGTQALEVMAINHKK